jgi:hypothetical protein
MTMSNYPSGLNDQPEPAPRTVGELIDELFETRTLRLVLEKKAEALKKEEARLSDFLIGELKQQDTTAMRGHQAMFSIKKVVVPSVLDWPKVFEFIKENDAFSLVQKRIGVQSWNEYNDSGLVVPGTEALELDKYSLTKSK